LRVHARWHMEDSMVREMPEETCFRLACGLLSAQRGCVCMAKACCRIR
jgi:hypothetical protein